MTATLSPRGNIALPKSLRHKYGLAAGDRFTISEERGRFVFAPQQKPPARAAIKISKITGMPYISTNGRGSVITSEMVSEMLADFP